MKKKQAAKAIPPYRGVDIIIDGTEFVAETEGRTLRAGAYETLRKKLDEAIKFVPFDAYRWARYSSSTRFEKIRVIGVDTNVGAAPTFRLAGGETIDYTTDLFPLSAKKALEAVVRLKTQQETAETRHKLARKAADRKVPRLDRPDGRPNRDWDYD